MKNSSYLAIIAIIALLSGIIRKDHYDGLMGCIFTASYFITRAIEKIQFTLTINKNN